MYKIAWHAWASNKLPALSCFLQEELDQLACVVSQLSQGKNSHICDQMSVGYGTELGT